MGINFQPVWEAFIFSNGMVMVFDIKGYQVPEAQGRTDHFIDWLQKTFPENEQLSKQRLPEPQLEPKKEG
jgi:hypothetical protein